MKDHIEAIEYAKEVARETYPPDEWHIHSTLFSDGDYRIEVCHGMNTTDEGNTVQDRITITPHQETRELVEITKSDEWKVLGEPAFE